MQFGHKMHTHSHITAAHVLGMWCAHREEDCHRSAGRVGLWVGTSLISNASWLAESFSRPTNSAVIAWTCHQQAHPTCTPLSRQLSAAGTIAGEYTLCSPNPSCYTALQPAAQACHASAASNTTTHQTRTTTQLATGQTALICNTRTAAALPHDAHAVGQRAHRRNRHDQLRICHRNHRPPHLQHMVT